MDPLPESARQFLQCRKETLMVDLAIHLAVDVAEAREIIQPLVAAGQVQVVWLAMKTPLRDLCSCDRQEVLRWLAN